MASPFGTSSGSAVQSLLLHPSFGKPSPERLLAGVGSSSNAASFVSAGIPIVLVLLNRNLATDPSTPATDLEAYGDAVDAVIDHYGASNFAAILIEDEPLVLANFNGTRDRWAAMLDAAASRGAAKGVPVGSGPIGAINIAYATYQDFLARGLTAEAADYWTRVVTGPMTQAAAAAQAPKVRDWLTSAAGTGVDYVSAKMYAPGPAWADTAAFISSFTGKTPIAAELAQLDDLTATTDLLAPDAVGSQSPIVLLQILATSPGHALVSGTSLTAIGDEWVNFIIDNYEQTGSNAACLLGIHASPRADDEAVIVANGKEPAGTPTTRFGISGFGAPADKAISMATALDVDFVRTTAFLLTPGTYSADPALLQAAGIRFALNVHNVAQPPPGQPPGASTPPTDINAYKVAVAAAMDYALPDLVVVENEASYFPHFNGSSAQYKAMVDAVKEVASVRGVPVATDGLISNTVIQLSYLILDAEANITDRDALWAGWIAGGGDPTPPVAGSGWDKWLLAYAASQADYVNIHVYGHSYGLDYSLIAIAAGAIGRKTGKPVITNECNPDSDDGLDTIDFLTEFSSLGFDWVIVWSHDSGTAVSFFANDGTLRYVNDSGLYGPGEGMRDYVAGLGAVAYVAEKNAILRLESELAPQRVLGADRVYRPLSPGPATAVDDYIAWTIDQGRRVVLSVQSAYDDGTIIPFADVAAGLFDADIDLWADAIAALDPTPVYLTFTHEPDMGYAAVGQTLAEVQTSYRAAWQRIHGRFATAGVTNVDWTLILIGTNYTRQGGIYPADGWDPTSTYVDVYGGDHYNPFNAFGGQWGEFPQRYADFVAWARNKGYTRWLVGETASLEDPADPQRKANWIKDLRDTVKASYPEVECLCWFTGSLRGWWIEQPPQGSPQALAEFSAMAADPYFGGAGGPPLPRIIVSIAVNPDPVAPGTQAIGTVYLDGPAPFGGIDVGLSTSSPNVIVPAVITVGAGSASLDFIVDTLAVGAEEDVIITGTIGGSFASTVVHLGAPNLPGLAPQLFEYQYRDLIFGGDGAYSEINVESVQGLELDVRDEVDPKGARHGSFTFGRFLKERRIIVAGDVHGPRTRRVELLQRLAEVFQPDNVDRPFKFQYLDGIVKLVYAKTVRKSTPIDKVAAKSPTPYAVELLAGDPLIYEDATRSLTLQPANVGTSGVPVPVVMPAVFELGPSAFGFAINAGLIGAPLRVFFYGPATNPQLANLETGELLKLNLAIADGDYIEVDVGEETVLLNGTATRITNLDPTSTFFTLGPGTTRLQFIADATGEQTRAMIEWSAAWPAAV
jgi:tail protein